MKMDFYKFFGYLSWLNYIWWLLELNLAMMAVNLPMLLMLLAVRTGEWSLPLLLVAGITLGPSILAAFSAMPYIEDGIVRHYFRNLKADWKKALKVWLPFWLLMWVLGADVEILEFFQVMEPLKWFLLTVLLYLVSFVLGFFQVWARWRQRARDAAVLTLKLSFVKPVRFHLNLLILIGTVILFGQKPVYLLLYGAAVCVFLVYKNFVPVAEFVNNRPENQTKA